VNIPPEFVHEPALLKTTGRPELLFAATLKAVLYAALTGAWTVTVIIWGIEVGLAASREPPTPWAVQVQRVGRERHGLRAGRK